MKKESLDTRIHLVAELQKLPPTCAILEIINEAVAGEYHDYLNQKYVCGKMAAVEKLRAAGLEDLAKRVINGDFDEECDEESKEVLRKDTPKHMWPMLGLEKTS